MTDSVVTRDVEGGDFLVTRSSIMLRGSTLNVDVAGSDGCAVRPAELNRKLFTTLVIDICFLIMTK